jgi:hypothetical protein
MTRILLTLILVFCISFMARAQFKKNDILLGGQLSYSYNSSTYTQPNASFPTNDSKSNYGNITISLGKALNENTVVGINLSYTPSSSTNYPSYNGNIPLKYQSNGYNAGIFYRKYKSLGKEFYLFGEASAWYSWSDQSGKDSIGEKLISGSSWSVGIDLYPGIAYRISKHLFLELSVPNLFYAGYSKSNSANQYGTASEVQTTKNDQLIISTSLSSNPLNALGIGFRLIL